MSNIVGIYDDDVKKLLEGIVDLEIHRASYVEPKGDKWYVSFSPLKSLPEFHNHTLKDLGPYDTREEAIKAETKLLAHLFKDCKY